VLSAGCSVRWHQARAQHAARITRHPRGVLPSKLVNIKTTATIVTTGGALAAWLAGAVTTNHVVAPSTTVVDRPAAATIDARSAALATEIGRLHERLRPSASPRQPGRNLFRFHAAPAAPAAAVVPPPAPIVAPPPEPQAPTMRLIGVAEDPGPDGPKRIAFITSGGQLFNVKEGETILARYKVAKIAAEVVELTDSTDGSVKRLALR